MRKPIPSSPPLRIATVSLYLLATAAVLTWGGCGSRESGEAPSDESVEPASSGAGRDAAARAVGAEVWIDDFRIGREVDPEGAIPFAEESDEFAPGESVYVSMTVSAAPADATVHVMFEGRARETVAEDAKKVPAEAHHLYFDSGDTMSWEPGDYRVVVEIDGRTVSELDFTLTDRPPAESDGEARPD